MLDDVGELPQPVTMFSFFLNFFLFLAWLLSITLQLTDAFFCFL